MDSVLHIEHLRIVAVIDRVRYDRQKEIAEWCVNEIGHDVVGNDCPL